MIFISGFLYTFLQVNTQKLLCQNTHHKGEYGNAKADQCHFPEAGEEGHILRHGSVISKGGDNGYHHKEHTKKRGDKHLRREEDKGQNEKYYGNKVGAACIGTGFQRVPSSLAFGGEKFG